MADQYDWSKVGGGIIAFFSLWGGIFAVRRLPTAVKHDKVKDLDTKVGAIDTKFDAMQNKFDDMERIMTAIVTAQSNLQTSHEILERRINKNEQLAEEDRRNIVHELQRAKTSFSELIDSLNR